MGYLIVNEVAVYLNHYAQQNYNLFKKFFCYYRKDPHDYSFLD